MQIQCPVCGETGETDETPAIGQHIICQFCQHKFSYLCGDENADRGKCNIGTRQIKSVGKIEENGKSAHKLPRRDIVKKKIGYSGLQIRKKICKECGSELHPKAVICPKCGCACAVQSRQKLWDGSRSGVEMESKKSWKLLLAIFVAPILAIWIGYKLVVQENLPSNSEIEHGVKERFLKETHAYYADFFAKAQMVEYKRWKIHFTVEYKGKRSAYDATAEMDNNGKIHYYMPILRVGEWGVGAPRSQPWWR